MTEHFDLIVFGGSPAGVAGAVAAADKGASVLLLSQTGTVGGAISNGLGASDIGAKTAVTGYQKKFFDAVKSVYSNTNEWDAANAWDVEPGVAENIFLSHLDAADVSVVLNASLQSVEVHGRQIASIATSQGVFTAPHFIDASYPSDLAAMAGAPFRLGYEDMFYYDEPYAHDREWVETAVLTPADVPGADSAFADNPFFVSLPAMPASYAAIAHLGMPSMTFRLSVCNEAANLVPFVPTANYELYANSWRRFMRAFFLTHDGGSEVLSNGTILNQLFRIAKVKGNKYDLNQGDAGFLNVPIPRAYFEGDRQGVLDLLEDYSRNFLFFAQTDPSVPSAIRASIAPFGLSADEFISHGNWPREAYIREGRRIVGRRTLTTRNVYDVAGRESADSVAIGTYKLDSKRSVSAYSRGVCAQDSMPTPTTPFYEIPLSVMLPVSIDNLLVPIGLSSSPTAYGPTRMEPQYMALGEAAGVTAYIAKLKATTISDAAANWYRSIKYTLTQPSPAGRGAVIKIRTLAQMIPWDTRTRKGFDPWTCAPVPFTPTDG